MPLRLLRSRYESRYVVEGEPAEPDERIERDPSQLAKGIDLELAALIEPGERTGVFRAGGAQLLVDGDGNSRISVEDYAVALADLLESGQPVRTRISVTPGQHKGGTGGDGGVAVGAAHAPSWSQNLRER
jgi:hypothetical protein